MDKRLSIYVSSPDSYSDVLEVYLRCFKKYWNDCPYEFILTTNSRNYEGVTCICNNKPGDTWIERTIAAYSHITSKYILMMCDDILINGNVDNEKIESILDYMDENDINFCRLNPVKQGETILGVPFLNKVNKQMPYAVNLQIGIFRMEYFKEVLGDGTLSAWDIENKLNTDASKAEDCLSSDVISANSVVIPFIHGVDKGKWYRKAISFIKKEYPEYNFVRPALPMNIELKNYAIELIQYNLSPGCRRIIKEMAQKMGFGFASNN